MFTLKLYRRTAPIDGRKMHKVIAVRQVMVAEIGKTGHALELWAFTDEKGNYETYYVGEPEPGMEAHGRNDLHLDYAPGSWWGWGLLENWEGNTSEHYRPSNYG
jgi:hypothetical protein